MLTIDRIEESAKSINPSIAANWDAMVECGMIEDLIDDCQKRFANRGMNPGGIHDYTVFVILEAAKAWDYAIAWAKDRIDDAL